MFAVIFDNMTTSKCMWCWYMPVQNCGNLVFTHIQSVTLFVVVVWYTLTGCLAAVVLMSKISFLFDRSENCWFVENLPIACMRKHLFVFFFSHFSRFSCLVLCSLWLRHCDLKTLPSSAAKQTHHIRLPNTIDSMKLYHLHVFCHRQKVAKQNMQNKVQWMIEQTNGAKKKSEQEFILSADNISWISWKVITNKTEDAAQNRLIQQYIFIRYL